MEKWKEYSGNPRYLISSHGRVKSMYKRSAFNFSTDGTILTGSPNNLGYKKVYFRQLNPTLDAIAHSVHRLVAIAFVPNPKNLPEVRIMDGDKENVRADNLEWCTHQEIIQKSYDTGQRVPITGEDHWMYGKEVSEATKKQMRLAKLGINHPKYTGYYLVRGHKYYSSKKAADATGENQRTIQRRCHNDKFPKYGFVLDPERIG
jgi:hypothetical protein